MGIKEYGQLHDKQTVSSVGNKISTYASDKLVVTINGTSTSFTIKFQASQNGVDFYDLEANKSGDRMTYATSTSVVGDAWELDVSAWSSFRANLTAIGNGYISVVATTA